jgi:Lysozyme like domain
MVIPALRRRRRTRLGLGDTVPGATLADLAANAGFTGSDIAVAAAIAQAESGGNSQSYNPELAAKGGTPQGKGSFGLWQIYLRDHPEFAGWNLYDPQTNANAAYAVYQAARSFSPWTTFRSGAYQRYLTLPSAPLTIDASTGEVLDNSVMDAATPDFLTVSTSNSQLPQIIFLTLGALGLYYALAD